MKKICLIIFFLCIVNSLYSTPNNGPNYFSTGVIYTNYVGQPFQIADNNKLLLKGVSISFKGEEAIFSNKKLALIAKANYFLPSLTIIDNNSVSHNLIAFNQDLLIGINYSKPIFNNSFVYVGAGLHLGSNMVVNIEFSYLSYEAGLGVDSGIKINLSKTIFLDLGLQTSLDLLQWATFESSLENQSGFTDNFIGYKSNISCLLCFKL